MSDSLSSHMDDQENLSDASEDESYSYSGPPGEPLSRDTSEPLFDSDFQSPTQPPEPQPADTEDLLGLNSDALCAPAPPPQQSSTEGGMKASSSNSDLLNDLFAPAAAAAQQDDSSDLIGEQTGPDLFFSGAPSNGAGAAAAAAQPPKSKINMESSFQKRYTSIFFF